MMNFNLSAIAVRERAVTLFFILAGSAIPGRTLVRDIRLQSEPVNG